MPKIRDEDRKYVTNYVLSYNSGEKDPVRHVESALNSLKKARKDRKRMMYPEKDPEGRDFSYFGHIPHAHSALRWIGEALIGLQTGSQTFQEGGRLEVTADISSIGSKDLEKENKRLKRELLEAKTNIQQLKKGQHRENNHSVDKNTVKDSDIDELRDKLDRLREKNSKILSVVNDLMKKKPIKRKDNGTYGKKEV